MFSAIPKAIVRSAVAKRSLLRLMASSAVNYEWLVVILIFINSYDLLVIGAGSGGISCAQQASANGNFYLFCPA